MMSCQNLKFYKVSRGVSKIILKFRLKSFYIQEITEHLN
jgi:hypothetical protein